MDREPGERGTGGIPDPGCGPGTHAARDRRLAGFGPGGELAGAFPSAALGLVAEELAGPERRYRGADEGELAGLARVWAALESRAAGQKLAAIAEMMRRDAPWDPVRPDDDGLPERCSDSLRHELSLSLACSPQSAERTAWLARELHARLPVTGALLDDGTLTLAKARAVAEVFRDLSDTDAGRAEALIAGRVAGRTHAQVARLAEEAALKTGPDLARRRREAAQRHGARVQLFREPAGTAGLSGRDLPPDQALSAMAAVVARAPEYRESGAFAETPADVLRAWAYLDKLNDIPAADRIAWAATCDDDDDGEEAAADAALARLRATLTGEPGGPAPDPRPDADPAPGTDPGPVPWPGADPGSDPWPGPDPNPDEDAGSGTDRDPGSGPGPSRGRGAGGDPEAGSTDNPGDNEPGDSEPGDSESGNEGGDGGDPGGGDLSGEDPGGEDPGDDGPGDEDGDGGGGPGGGRPGGGGPGGSGSGGAGRRPGTSPPGLAGTGRLPRPADFIVPLRTLLGLDRIPGDIHGFGLLDPALAAQLAAAAAASPRTGICLLVTSPEGYAMAHGCTRPHQETKTSRSPLPPPSSREPSLTEFPARMILTIPATALPHLASRTSRPGGPGGPASRAGPGVWDLTPRPGTRPPHGQAPHGQDPDGQAWDGGYGTWTLTMPGGRQHTVRLDPVPTFECDHRYRTPAYQPGAKLRHLVQVRDWTCTFPTCNRHARDSDFEHAIPYLKGGETDACNAGARSRACHRVKQKPGWKLTQPRPGWHQWETPGGWTYTREPWRYPS